MINGGTIELDGTHYQLIGHDNQSVTLRNPGSAVGR
jgi:hypothetical protein